VARLHPCLPSTGLDTLRAEAARVISRTLTAEERQRHLGEPAR
jgi:hypothetical protein